ncbi:unnamed protein product, partial [Dicrocoelium dendriticum]
MGVRRNSESAVPFMVCYLLIAGQGAFRRAVGAGLSDYKKLASPKKADRTSTSAAAKRCAWEWSLLPPHPAPRQNDPRPTKKRPWSHEEAILVPRRSDP